MSSQADEQHEKKKIFDSEEAVKESALSDTDVTEENQDSETVESQDFAEELTTKLVKAEEEIASLKDSLLRKQADFENYRKRMIKEKEETLKYGNSNLLNDLVGVIDDFGRAIASGAESKDFDKFHEGISLIEKQFNSMLEKKWNLVKMDAVGEKFDPERHEALMMEEKDDIEEPVVADVFQNGYLLNNRIIRNAKVKVLMPGKKGEETEN